MILANMVVVILGVVAMYFVLGVLYLWKRNNEVRDFKMNVSNLCYERAIRIIKQKKWDNLPDWYLYDKLPSYDSMLWSFKPLKLESYYTEEEIKELTG